MADKYSQSSTWKLTGSCISSWSVFVSLVACLVAVMVAVPFFRAWIVPFLSIEMQSLSAWYVMSSLVSFPPTVAFSLVFSPMYKLDSLVLISKFCFVTCSGACSSVFFELFFTVMVIFAFLLFPSLLVTVIFAVPAFMAVTSPFLLTFAMLGLLLT